MVLALGLRRAVRSLDGFQTNIKWWERSSFGSRLSVRSCVGCLSLSLPRAAVIYTDFFRGTPISRAT